jgi:hypothetical protein
MKYVEEFLTYIVVAAAGGVVWLFRTVFTNQKQIAMLQEDIKSRDKRRDDDREILLELKSELKNETKEIRGDIEDLRSKLFDVYKK